VVIDNANLYASALHELAERQQAEAALRESNIELRTRNEELDAYAHTVAHDLKNPLGAVVGYVELLQSYDTLPSEIIQRILVGLQRSGQKATNIVEALLLLSSVRQQEIQAQPLNMADLIEEVLARLAETIRDSGVDLHLPDRASWPIALGYAPWVEEIWVNYISNAIKYGGAQPRIELSAERLPDGFVRYNVRDYGAGLTSEQQQRLFTPFERLGQAQIKGHGLGLSVVRRIAEKLSGQVGVESSGAPGEGSTFYFTLPGIPPEGYLFSPTSV
jgi:signal transduction histidine kinase